MSYALSITEAFNFLLQHMAELENQATVVERIREASQHIPQEDDWVKEEEDDRLLEWPERGAVSYTHLTLPTNREV